MNTTTNNNNNNNNKEAPFPTLYRGLKQGASCACWLHRAYFMLELSTREFQYFIIKQILDKYHGFGGQAICEGSFIYYSRVGHQVIGVHTPSLSNNKQHQSRWWVTSQMLLGMIYKHLAYYTSSSLICLLSNLTWWSK